MKLVTMGEAEVNFPSLLEEAQHERVVVERNGQPLGVILSIADYQDWTSMREDVELLTHLPGMLLVSFSFVLFTPADSLTAAEGARLRHGYSLQTLKQ
ncbi:MAG: type II toxin-antitoxin system Phd/YefM family antitoxin [Armatimonadetes bacterium]|nr:type II toxin-antitoxin system Phd/YefM family antitoxin [Armatimonadota bacterium]